jgi:ribonuclease HII
MRIIGIDEVGRGCLAGPVVAAAVLLDDSSTKTLSSIVLTDSKKMTKLQREKADSVIREKAVAYGIGWVHPQEVDAIGLTAAVQRAMQQAVEMIHEDYDKIIIDGNYNFLKSNLKAITMVKADLSEVSVSAASVIAKVARDSYMYEQARIHTGYGFEAHVGYGTAMHINALKELGPCILHRKSVKPVASLLPAIL